MAIIHSLSNQTLRHVRILVRIVFVQHVPAITTPANNILGNLVTNMYDELPVLSSVESPFPHLFFPDCLKY